MVRGNISTNGPTPHSGLGLEGYVQFTSPIRRYGDMLAHLQLKVITQNNQIDSPAPPPPIPHAYST